MLRLLRNLASGFSPRRMPWALLAAAVMLALIGVLFIRSAQPNPSFARRQLQFLGLGIVAFLAVAVFDYRHLASFSTVLYAAGLAALSMLPFLGVDRNYARRWFEIGPVLFQPSEPMKYAVVLVTATYFSYRVRIGRLRDLAIPLVLCLTPMLLILRQPNLGTSLLLLPAFLAVAFLAGVPVRNLAILIVAGALLGGIAWRTPLIKQYQKERVLAFLFPERTQGTGAQYNAEQATLAITGGGPWGQGWGRGQRTLLRMVPESHTDFIFPVVAEEWGFVRTSAIMAFYVLAGLLMAGIARDAPDKFGALVAGGVMALFCLQALLHMAISLRLAPITGLPLPLLSYGGSSLVTTMAGLGLAASVGARRTHPARDPLQCPPARR